jgi:hypothetical protein
MFRAFRALFIVVFAAGLQAQTTAARTHRLEATPQTVAYGYYWRRPPAIRIASGDIIDVDTPSRTPRGLNPA